MSDINSPALAHEVNSRIRRRAESMFGISALLSFDGPVLGSLAGAFSQAGTIDDGHPGPIPFTGSHALAYLGLLQSLGQAAGDSTLMGAIHAAMVRQPEVIIASMSETPVYAGADPLVAALANRIRPRARHIIRLRYAIQHDLRILPALVAGYDDADVIVDGREGEGIAPLTVGTVNVLLAAMASMVGEGVNTEDVANAIDAAIGVFEVVQ